MRIAIVFALSLLVGCSALVNPDTGRLMGDSGPPMGDAMVLPDGGTSDAWVDPGVDGGVMPTDDAGSDAGVTPGDTCASLPLGDMTLSVVSSTCDGPFMLAQSFSGRVRDTGSACIVNAGTLRVICDHTYQNLTFSVGTLSRVGTTYTSEDVMLGCEGVTYTCHLVADSSTNEHHVDCTMGASTCTIDLE